MHERCTQVPVSIDEIPCPFHYADFFSSLTNSKNKYWDTIQDIENIESGDVIAYLPRNYVPKEIVRMQSGRTGMHIMIVGQVLQVQKNQIKLMIIDCTRFPHCKEDNRLKGGIGRAPLTIYVESKETLLQWGTRKKKWEKDLFVGRLKDRT